MFKFSIIIPVYNVEKYLRQCLDSILVQSFNNYEMILVDDGSTDQSGDICDEFAFFNNNISVIHKNNGGLSDARNIGIKEAKGDYIIFIDSDDYIELGTLEKFNSALQQSDAPDVLITRLKSNYEYTDIMYMDENMPIEVLKNGEKEEVMKWMFSHSNSLWPSVRYVVKNSLIKNNHLEFPFGYLHEDIEWTTRLFLHANTFTVSDFYWYNHRMGRQGSITTNKNLKRALDIISLVSKNIKDIECSCSQIELRNIICQRLVKSLFSSLSNYKFCNDEEKQTIIEVLEINKSVFKYAPKFHHKIFAFFSRVFGFNISLSLMNVFHKV